MDKISNKILDITEILNEKKVILEFLDENYEIVIQNEKLLDENFIFVSAKKHNHISNFIYVSRMKFEDFKKSNSESTLLVFYDTIQKLFDFISDSINEEKISIKAMNHSHMTLLITAKFPGFKEILSLEIDLKKKECDIDDTIKMLCIKINELEKENKTLRNELNIIKFKMDNNIFENENEQKFIINRLLKIPGCENKKVTFRLLYRLSINGTNVEDFHKMCNNVSNNLTLIKTKQNERFGGFTQLEWTSSNTNRNDDKSFCFSLSKMKIYDPVKGYNTIGDMYSNGPMFCDIFYIGTNNSLNFGSCSTNSNSGTRHRNLNNKDSTTYELYEINNGQQNFNVNEFEFYEVKFE